MSNEDLQVENGNFTRIVNPLMDALIQIPFKGCELAVALYIIRKTYGYNKTQDEISLSQFCAGLSRSRPTIVVALKNLQLVNIVKLVKRGNSRKSSNMWAINKYASSWKLVKLAELVTRSHGTSKAEGLQLVKTALHTKDNTKNNNTKDSEVENFSPTTTTNETDEVRIFAGLVEARKIIQEQYKVRLSPPKTLNSP